MGARWPRIREMQLRSLVKTGKYTYPEIGKMMGLNANQCRTKGQYLGLVNPVYSRKIIKHAHLREPVMRYFLNHTWEETRRRFNLSQSELRSLFTVGYRDPALRHLRKDSRRKDIWSQKEVLFLLRHAGLQPRAWISKKLGRGGVHSVKESLERLKINSKCINGLTYRWACEFFGTENVDHSIKSKAGPMGGGRGDFRYRIVPWVICEEIAKRHVKSHEVRTLIASMARFQRWIHDEKNERTLIRKMTKASEKE